MAASSHLSADASQKVIVPAVTGAPAATTDAVRVTAAGHTTDDDEIVSVVVDSVVDMAAACAAIGRAMAIASKAGSSLEFWLIQESSDRTYKVVNTYGTGNTNEGGPIQSMLLTYSANFVWWKFSAIGQSESYITHQPGMDTQLVATLKGIGTRSIHHYFH
jgi:hypothetical protein